MSEIRRVGFLGTGIMGGPMAVNLAAVGFEVGAWNRDPRKAKALERNGLRSVATPAEAARECDALVVMLSSGAVCDEVLLGKGALAAMRPGALLVVMSSIAVDEARSQAEQAASLGLRYLDAPVSGGERGALEGSLSIMVGGDAEAFEAAAPLFAPLGRALHVGPTGSGQFAKLVNQLTVASTIVAVSEAMLLATAGGANAAQVREALLGGFAGSRILEQHGDRMLRDDYAPGGPAKYQVKDLRAARTMAERLNLRLPMLELADSLFSDLVEHGGGDYDHSALILELRRRNGLDPVPDYPLR
jgi:3-hydroxyisobutyrate dehydrogenase-like beta-hydroxyacid dehydrogenase